MDEIRVVPSDPAWPAQYQAERDQLLELIGPHFVEIEHVGSTAVPGLQAKPIIDLMASVPDIEAVDDVIAALVPLGYRMVETGMRNRLLLRREGPPAVHLHLVGHDTWPKRKERLMRDHLRAYPEDARRYGDLKEQLARLHPDDGLAYTRAKTALIQEIMDRARAERGLPPEDVWED